VADSTPNGNGEARFKRLHLLAGILAGLVSASIAIGGVVWKAGGERATMQAEINALRENQVGIRERLRRMDENSVVVAENVAKIRALSEVLLDLVRELNRTARDGRR
jgi:uncharacterized membrane protein YfbV (UPF0208 family)